MPRPKLPKIGAGSARELTKCVEYGIKKETQHRLNRFRTWERARLYNQSIQWLQPSVQSLVGDTGSISPFWMPRQVSENEWYPMPVMNEIAPTIQNEKARILGAGSKAYVRPKSSDTSIERAAKLATDALKDAQERLQWPLVEDLASLHQPLYGTCIFKSWWDLDYTKTIDLPVQGAMRCPECQNEYSAPSIDRKYVPDEMQGTTLFEQNVTLDDEGETFSIKQCVGCGSPLVGFDPFDPAGKDVFGRNLFEPVPKGDLGLKIVSPYEYFPQNDGLDLGDPLEFYEERIESVEWIAAHYEQGHKVKPESVQSLVKWHPILGALDWGGSEAGEDAIYDHHAAVKEMHRLPWIETDEFGKPRLNRGRSVIVANNVILLDQEYLIESKTNPGEFIPRVIYSECPWEIRDCERWGLSLPELLFKLQDAINCLLSQVQDVRHRFGSPKILAEEDMSIRRSGQLDTGYQSDVLYYTPTTPGQQPQLFGNVQMSGNWTAELDRLLDAMSRIAGTMDVEIGEAPKNVSAASAVMYLGEKASERRKARIARFSEAKKRIYKHLLQLMHEMYVEPRQYSVRGRNDKWEIKSFIGADLKNQDDIVIESESAYDMRMFRREVIKDGINSGTIAVDTAAAKRRINEEWGVPREINEELNNQVDMAEEEWLKFQENAAYQPAVDVVGDDHLIHFKTHILSLQQQGAQEVLEAMNWNICELALYGWEETYDALLAAEEVAKMPIQQPMKDPTGNISPEAHQLFLQQQQQQAEAKAMVESYPKAPELRITQIWQTMLEPLMTPQIARIIRFKAHLMAHYKLAMQQMAMAGSGVPLPAAPGGSETVSGVIPGNPAQALPGPGAGMGATTASGEGNA